MKQELRGDRNYKALKCTAVNPDYRQTFWKLLAGSLQILSLFSFFILYTLYFLLSAKLSFAQTNNTITVFPSIISLDLKIDKPKSTLNYVNNTSNTVELSLSASDFTTDGNNLSFLNPVTAKNYKYALSNWITFSSKDIVIEPHSNTQVNVFINPNHLSSGGHYASILAKIISKNSSLKVQIQGIISTLLFVRTNHGNEIDNANIETFKPEQNFLNFPKNFILRIENTGDTVLTPYGLIQIYDPTGRLVAKSIVNENSLFTLPGTLRRFDLPVSKFNNFLWPGIYHAHLTLNFGEKGQIKTRYITFISEGSLPLNTIFLIIILMGIIMIWKHLKVSKNKDS